jgi:tetratricopeptide (TPR) repeat protein
MIMQKLFTPLLLPFLTVAALAVLFLCGGCSKEQVSKRESLRWTEMGETALKADDWNEAVRCYTEALAADSTNTDALYGRSGARLVTGNEFYLLARAAAGEGEITRAREIAAKADRDFALAAEDAASLLKINPDASEACYILGCVAIYQGDWLGALDAFTETIKRAPEMASAYQRRGEVYGFINDIENESADLKRAAELGYTSEEESDALESDLIKTAEVQAGDSVY